jgi:predicted esterase
MTPEDIEKDRSAGGGAAADRIEEIRIETPRTARVALLRSGPDPVTRIWTLLHGYAQSGPGFLRWVSAAAKPGRLLVAPEGLSRFYRNVEGTGAGRGGGVGASWMTREERDAEIRDYVRYLDRVTRTVEGPHVSSEPKDRIERRERSGGASLPPLRRVVLGFSQGVHTAVRWTVLGRTRIDALVLWGASFPPDLPASAGGRLMRVPIMLVRGEADALRRPEEETRDERWLETSGIAYRILTHSGGHEVVPELLEGIEGGFE